MRARCGDGITRTDLVQADPGYEACDDGNAEQADGCTSGCVLAACGDGILRQDLTPEQDGYEECDDGNRVELDGCSAQCESERCGNGRIDAGEQCDDGNDSDADGCSNGCREVAAVMEFARRSLILMMEGFEACDDGNQIAGDGCSPECRLSAAVMVCLMLVKLDDGNDQAADACTNRCQEARCGDGIVRRDVNPDQQGYEAAMMATKNGDGCTASCRRALRQWNR